MHKLPKFTELTGNSGGPTPSRPGFATFNTAPNDNVKQEVVRLQAQDGGWSRGILYTKGNAKTVLFFVHPKGDFSTHYAIPALTAAGYAAFGHQNRYFNNDTLLVHEYIMADIGASVKYLREQRGFKRVILVGNSGGGSLDALYQAQAATSPPDRLTHTAGGQAYDMNALDLRPADGVIFIAVHSGEGNYILGAIDPSVTDENDPLSCDPTLDMYNPDNGYVPLPAPSRYTKEFLERYRTAQAARVRRINAIARQRIVERHANLRLIESPDFGKLPPYERALIERKANADRYITVYRTEVNPAFCDPSISPSPRRMGSIISLRPDINNYRIGGFASCVIPEAWLSTWSAFASHGQMFDNLALFKIPTLFVNFTADNCVYPDQNMQIFDACASEDKTVIDIEAEHYGLMTDGSTRGRDIMVTGMLDWLKSRYPQRED